MTSTARTPRAKLGLALLWVVTVLETAGMGLAGASKFMNPGGWTSMFEGWGYPAWLAFVIGASELVGALLLLVPRLASYAAGLLIVIMIGALATVLMHPGRMGPGTPLLHLVVLAIILVARRGSRWRPRSGD